MRGRVFKCALAIAGLGVVATAATALSTRAPTPYDQTLTLAGGADALDRERVDPDAPIATARYGDKPRGPVSAAATVDLAGAPSATTLAGGPVSAPPTKPVELAQVSPTPTIQTLSPPRARLPARAEAASITRTSTPALGLVRSSAHRVKVTKIDDIEIRPFTPPSDRSAFMGVSINASTLMDGMRTTSRDAKKGRWILFAATSGKALSLNVIRDSIVGWRGAGWAEERIARFGTHQLGMGWRKNGRQVSLSATRRSLRTQNYSDRDMVYGVSLSFSGR